MKINVCCVKEGNKYDKDYVNILYNMIEKNLSSDFNFYCFTENPTGLNKNIIVKNLIDKTIKGWWNKCLLFKPGVLSGQCLYLDLDMIIIRPIDNLLLMNDKLNIAKNVFFKWRYFKITNINSSIMCWNTERFDGHRIWDQYLKEKNFYDNAFKTKIFYSDQEVIKKSGVKYNFFEDEKIIYFKRLTNEFKISENVSVVVCKGEHQKNHKDHYLVKDYWK